MTVTSKKKTQSEEKVEETTITRGTINYHCNYCQIDIANHRIHCVQCVEFDLCVFCFTNGVEIENHKNYHDYQIIKTHTFPIFEKDWGADEELLLLEAIEMFGMGNWQSCADYVGSKTKDQCFQHYKRVYLSTKYAPLPDTTKEFDLETDTTKGRRYYNPSVPSNKVWASIPSNCDVQGYMPGRLEFETEYENEGENAIADLSFHENDSQEEIQYKLALLDAYNNKINKREYRKRFLTERNLVDYKKNQALDKKRTREEKQIYSNLKVFARLQSSDAHETFCDVEEDLKNQIAKLQEYRRNGITTISEGEAYEKLKESKEATPRSQVVKEFRYSQLWDKPLFSNFIAVQEGNLQNPLEEPAAKRVIGRKQPQPLDISQAEGLDLLFTQEIELCSVLRLLPLTYLKIKETLIAECASQGFLRRRRARSLVKIDVTKTSRVYDFLLRMGWVNSSIKEVNE